MCILDADGVRTLLTASTNYTLATSYNIYNSTGTALVAMMGARKVTDTTYLKVGFDAYPYANFRQNAGSNTFSVSLSDYAQFIFSAAPRIALLKSRHYRTASTKKVEWAYFAALFRAAITLAILPSKSAKSNGLSTYSSAP